MSLGLRQESVGGVVYVGKFEWITSWILDRNLEALDAAIRHLDSNRADDTGPIGDRVDEQVQTRLDGGEKVPIFSPALGPSIWL
jgi:hypothetical protein